MEDEASDILIIDKKIRNKFEKNISMLEEYKTRLEEVNKSLLYPNMQLRMINELKESKKLLEDRVYDVENGVTVNFYTAETAELIEDYKKCLLTPIIVSFSGKPMKKDKKKRKIIQKYLKIAARYTDIDVSSSNNCSSQIKCVNCNNKTFDIDNTTYICSVCFTEQIINNNNTSSYNDNERINMYTKYTYNKQTHFKDAIKQYQGKQNSTIPDAVYNDLEEQFRRLHLLLDSEDKKIKYKNITKDLILILLKELGYNKHYENVHLIHYVFTGEKPHDISHLEDVIINDFNILLNLYDKKYKQTTTRKNFINTQYVLYQLLTRHRYICNKKDFMALKTVDRQDFHDRICKDMFEELGWNHTPFY